MSTDHHYREAVRLLAQAESAYLDDSAEALPREAYADDEEFAAALEEGREAYQQGIREATLFASMAQAHATLATAAPVSFPPAPLLSVPQCEFLRHALELAADAMANTPDEYNEVDEAALDSLRALAAAPGGEGR